MKNKKIALTIVALIVFNILAMSVKALADVHNWEQSVTTASTSQTITPNQANLTSVADRFPNAQTVSVSTLAQLQDAVETAPLGQTRIINITSNMGSATGTQNNINIPGNRNIVFTGSGRLTAPAMNILNSRVYFYANNLNINTLRLNGDGTRAELLGGNLEIGIIDLGTQSSGYRSFIQFIMRGGTLSVRDTHSTNGISLISANGHFIMYDGVITRLSTQEITRSNPLIDVRPMIPGNPPEVITTSFTMNGGIIRDTPNAIQSTSGGTVIINNGIMENIQGSAIQGRGSGVEGRGPSTIIINNLTLRNSTNTIRNTGHFGNNTFHTHMIYAVVGHVVITINNINAYNNTIEGGNNGQFAVVPSLIGSGGTNEIIINNGRFANNASENGGTIIGFTANHVGSLSHDSESRVTINGGYFYNNISGGNGGVIRMTMPGRTVGIEGIDGGPTGQASNNPFVTINGGVFRDNRSWGQGGAIFTNNLPRLYVGEDVIFENNRALWFLDPAQPAPNIHATRWTFPLRGDINGFDIMYQEFIGQARPEATLVIPDPLVTDLSVSLINSGSGATGQTTNATEQDIITIYAGTREYYIFDSWTVESPASGVILENGNNATTTFTMPTVNVSIRAEWSEGPNHPNQRYRTVSLVNVFEGATGSTATARWNDSITIYAGYRTDWRFAGWTVTAGGTNTLLADHTLATTTFNMPAVDTIVIEANWIRNPIQLEVIAPVQGGRVFVDINEQVEHTILQAGQHTMVELAYGTPIAVRVADIPRGYRVAGIGQSIQPLSNLPGIMYANLELERNTRIAPQLEEHRAGVNFEVIGGGNISMAGVDVRTEGGGNINMRPLVAIEEVEEVEVEVQGLFFIGQEDIPLLQFEQGNINITNNEHLLGTTAISQAAFWDSNSELEFHPMEPLNIGQLPVGYEFYLEVEPHIGYRFFRWEITYILTGNTRFIYYYESNFDGRFFYQRFVVPEGGFDIVARLVPIADSVTFAALGQGTVTAQVDGTAITTGSKQNQGTVVTFTAIPQPNNRLIGWTVNGISALTFGADTTLVRAVTAGGLNVIAIFENVENNLTFTTIGQGSITATNMTTGETLTTGQNLAQNQQISFTATPNQNHRLIGWSINGIAHGNNATINQTMGTENMHVVAAFEPIIVPVQIQVIGNGTAQITTLLGEPLSLSTELPVGEVIILYLEETNTQELVSLHVNGTVDTTHQLQRQFTVPADGLDILVTFSDRIPGPAGPQGPQGNPGQDGNTPIIGDNGNWWINDQDTGVNAGGGNNNINAEEIDRIIREILERERTEREAEEQRLREEEERIRQEVEYRLEQERNNQNNQHQALYITPSPLYITNRTPNYIYLDIHGTAIGNITLPNQGRTLPNSFNVQVGNGELIITRPSALIYGEEAITSPRNGWILPVARGTYIYNVIIHVDLYYDTEHSNRNNEPQTINNIVIIAGEPTRENIHIGLRIGHQLIYNFMQNRTRTMDVVPFTQNGRTLVPIRFVSEELGADVDWNEQTNTVFITMDGQTLPIVIGQLQDGMDVPAQLFGSRTFVPLRFVAEHFGADVSWNDITSEIDIFIQR